MTAEHEAQEFVKKQLAGKMDRTLICSIFSLSSGSKNRLHALSKHLERSLKAEHRLGSRVGPRLGPITNWGQ